MNTSLKQIAIFIHPLIAFLFLSSTMTAQTPDFSGTWNRNTEKTNPGDLTMNSLPISLEIRQDKMGIDIRRTSKNGAGDTSTYTEALKFDGSLSESRQKINRKKRGVIKFSDDRKTLTETADYTDDQGTLIQKITETWTLAADGKTLEISSVLTLNGREYKLEEVFDRQ